MWNVDCFLPSREVKSTKDVGARVSGNEMMGASACNYEKSKRKADYLDPLNRYRLPRF